jgi:hypothetical protein
MMRKKDPADIRRDALRMGVQKAASDCYSCANSYFDLARENGATEAEIETALQRQFGVEYLTRRQALKHIAAGAASIAAVGAGLVPLEAAAAVNSFGTDTNTANCCGRLGPNFYIGRFGGETTSSTSNFNTTAARQTPGTEYNYMYWDLASLGWPGSGSNAYAWGQTQANAAVNAWYNNPNALLVLGNTIFADIEPGQYWGSNGQTTNRQVLQGWLDAIVSQSFIPGVYITPGNWNSYLGSGYRPTRAFALWLTGCHTCSISCNPCNSCTGVAAQVESYWSTVGQTVLGGSKAVVWQYWVDPPCGCGDWDYSNQSCYLNIVAVSSGSTYVCPGCGSGSPCP